MHQHMPELLQVLKDFVWSAVIAPVIWAPAERCFGRTDHRSVQHSVAISDSGCKAGHAGTTKIAWNILDVQSKAAVPSERDGILRRQIVKHRTSCGGRKRWINYQQL